MRMLRSAVFMFMLGAAATPVTAAPITIDFESLSEFSDVGGQIDGVTFTNATVLTAGSSLNDIDFPPPSGSNVVFDSAEPMRIDFDGGVSSVSAYITYVVAVTFSAYDSSDNLIASVQSAFAANFATSGVSSPNELIQLGSTSAISYVTFSGDGFGGSFTLDDLTFDTIDGGGGTDPGPDPVPEPATVSLVLLGAAVAVGRQKLRSRRHAQI